MEDKLKQLHRNSDLVCELLEKNRTQYENNFWREAEVLRSWEVMFGNLNMDDIHDTAPVWVSTLVPACVLCIDTTPCFV